MNRNRAKILMVTSVLGMTLSLGNMSVMTVAGQEEYAAETAQEQQDIILGSDAENVTNPDENNGAEQPDSSGDNQNPGAGNVTNPDKNNGAEQPDSSGDNQNPGADDNSGVQIPDQNKDDANNADQGNDNQENGSQGSDVPDDTPSEDKNQEKAEDNSGAVEEVTVEKETFTDNSSDAVYTEKNYNPSEKFLSLGEKVKYNPNMPLENIPAFITQEMVIGALKTQDEYGYPASVAIAQIIQESGFGKYGPNGESGQGLSYLAYQYNNLFGIKGTGTAGSVNMLTGEQTAAGESYTITAGFRVYNTYTECMEDRAKLLKKVYSDLTEGVTDANTFAVRIGGRWATSNTYAENLISQMETYDLYRLDRMTLQDFSKLVGEFADPCPGAVQSSGFGLRNAPTAGASTFHKGLDLATGGKNIPTYAAKEGTVIEAGYNPVAGNWVVIDHGNGIVTKYMHHAEIYVEKGQHVEKAQQIGVTGTTGISTGVHLHFQLEIDGTAVDPTPYLADNSDKKA